MAYTDYSFYKDKYYGDALTEANAAKWLEMASDEIDRLTHGRLVYAPPACELFSTKVKKAVCAVADALFFIDEQRKASSAQKAEDGSYRGAVASITSGRESVSYSAVGASASSYAAAAASEAEREKLIGNTACRYLANIPDANGVNLLYAGV